jgi:FKBP-type peptidyl-prolyl cis-trans isomerase
MLKFVCSLPNKEKDVMNKLILALIILFISCDKSGTVNDLGDNLNALDLAVGSGQVADEYDHVSVNYTGWLVKDSLDLYTDWSNNESKVEDKFDSSYDKNQPYEFQLSFASVIKGWDNGILGMKEGGKRILVIPADLAYGKRSPSPKIPPNSTLKFLVELVSVVKLEKPTVTDSVIGTGKEIAKDDVLKLHYTYITTVNGEEQVQSSKQANKPIPVKVGNERNPFFIKGYLEGVTLGTIRIIEVPRKESTERIILETLSFIPKPSVWDITKLDFKGTSSGLKFAIVEKGRGKSVKSGQTVKVHYSGYLNSNMEMFDSSRERDEPIEFPVGQGKVIPGWDEGMQLLKVGSKAVLIIPYTLGYGENDYGPIPGKSELRFDVEVIDAK